ncbi:MAG: hypothetical protein AAGU19_02335 [Prolixibacteraceae bacterium]
MGLKTENPGECKNVDNLIIIELKSLNFRLVVHRRMICFAQLNACRVSVRPAETRQVW